MKSTSVLCKILGSRKEVKMESSKSKNSEMDLDIDLTLSNGYRILSYILFLHS